MVIGYVRLNCSVEEAKARYGRWIGAAEVEPARLVPERKKVDLALVDEEWAGLAVFIYPSDSWTVIEELSGGLAPRSPDRWLELAQGGDLVYAAYNDTVPYAELVVVQQGKLVRQFLQDQQDPSADVNVGRLPEEADEPFVYWPDVAAWVDEDSEKLNPVEQGWLWIHAVSR